MKRVKAYDTAPECLLRDALARAGLKSTHSKRLMPGKPDIVFPKRRVAIFVDGDFWHGNQWRNRNLSSLEEQFRQKRQQQYWVSKIRRNMERDCRITAELIAKGWSVLRFWSSDLDKNLARCVAMVKAAGRKSGRPDLVEPLAAKRVAEFFAGIGLVRMGLERHGWKVAFANDNDENKLDIYASHFRDADRHFSVKDVHDLAPSDIPDITLATASFPCNDLSVAGSRDGLKGRHSSAFWGFIDAITGMRQRKPPLVLLENVPGLITSHGGKDFELVLAALNDLGYVVDAFVMDAAAFVPQSRQRLFIIGVLTSIPHSLPSPPPNLEAEARLRPGPLARFINEHPNILWYLRNLPAPPTSKKRLEEILEDLDPNHPAWWDTNRARYLFSQFSKRHRQIADKMIAGSRWSYGTVFRRIRHNQEANTKRSMAELRVDGIAGCLRTPRGGSARQILFKAGKGEYHVRLLTPRECARLMGADDYCLPQDISINQALFGFGDAVCVPVVEWIAEQYLNPLVNELLRCQPTTEVFA